MKSVRDHFNKIAPSYDIYKKKNWFYYSQLKKLLRSIISPRSSVLEIGCGTGDIINNLRPSRGIGMDISYQMILLADKKHSNKNIKFISGDISTFSIHQKFRYIIMCDVMEHLENPSRSIKAISRLMDKNTKFIITMANPKWEWILLIAEKLRLKMPEGPHNRMDFKELEILLHQNNMLVSTHGFKILFPIYIPFLTKLLNTLIEPMFQSYAFIEYLIIKKI